MPVSYKTTTSEKKIDGRTYSTSNTVRTDDITGSTIPVTLSGFIDTVEEKARFKDDIEKAFKEKMLVKFSNDVVSEGFGSEIDEFMGTKETAILAEITTVLTEKESK